MNTTIRNVGNHPAAIFVVPVCISGLALLAWTGPGPSATLNVFLFAAMLGGLSAALFRRGEDPVGIAAALAVVALVPPAACALESSGAVTGLAVGCVTALVLAALSNPGKELLLAPAAIATVLRFAKTPGLGAFAALAQPFHGPESAGIVVFGIAALLAVTQGLTVALGLAWFVTMGLLLPEAGVVSLAGLAVAAVPLLGLALRKLPAPSQRWIAAPALAGLLIALVLFSPRPLQPGQPVNPAPATAEQWIEISLAEFRAARYPAAVTAAQNAIRLQPDSAVAHNNLAAAYMAMRQWDAGISEALQALRLKPDFELAHNNLMWMEEQKKLENSAH